MEAATLLFLHIPKTAGSTMRILVTKKYGPNRSFLLSGPTVPRMQTAIDNFRALPQAERDRFDCVYGHYLYGVHEFFTRPTSYFTLLRDPIERAISHYHEMRRSEDQWGVEEVGKKGGTLEDFIDWQANTHTDNLQTRFLLRPATWDNIYDPKPLTPADLETAKNNLRSFSVVGTLERFDETLMLLKEKANWTIPFYSRNRVSKNRTRVQDLSDATIEKIRSINQYDHELWMLADQLLTEAIQPRAAEFAASLRRFRDMNRIFQSGAGVMAMARRARQMGKQLLRR
jgi:hypothetical protein